MPVNPISADLMPLQSGMQKYAGPGCVIFKYYIFVYPFYIDQTLLFGSLNCKNFRFSSNNRQLPNHLL